MISKKTIINQIFIGTFTKLQTILRSSRWYLNVISKYVINYNVACNFKSKICKYLHMYVKIRWCSKADFNIKSLSQIKNAGMLCWSKVLENQFPFTIYLVRNVEKSFEIRLWCNSVNLKIKLSAILLTLKTQLNKKRYQFISANTRCTIDKVGDNCIRGFCY